MNFAFDERQLEFRVQLCAFTDKRCTSEALRESWSSELGWSRERWRELADLGVSALSVPEAYGGMGLGEVDIVLLLEEAGRSGLPEPLMETCALGVPLLAEAPGEHARELRQSWFERVVSGQAVIAIAREQIGSKERKPALSAPARCVLHPRGADLLLLRHRGDLHALAASEVSTRGVRALDASRGVEVVDWEPSATSLLLSGVDAEVALARCAQRAAMACAALLVGVAQRLVDNSASYAKERVQFAKPIGSFQAVKHHLANALVRLEFTRPVVYAAAWALADGDPSAGRYSSMAKAMASDAATLAARVALQVHGAVGYTWEHDLHMFAKRAWSFAAAWGDASAHRARVLDALERER